MILIHLTSGKKFYVDKLKDFSTNFGIIKKEYLEKAKSGEVIKSHLNEEFLVLEDSICDILEIIKRGPQITHPKDFGMLTSLTGLSSGWNVVEGGSGSGVLTSLLANIVKPDGIVYTYEKNKSFLKIAMYNVSRLRLNENVVFKNKDIREGIDETNIDLVILDIPDPWNVLEHAWNSLKPGKFLAIFLPNMTSVLKTLEKLEKFYVDGIYECFTRKWVYKKKILRPKSTQIVHTEFLILARKILR